MNYTIDPELLFLKWAYRKGLLDDDALCEFNRRAFADEELESYLDALVAWNYIDTFEEYDAERIREFIAAHESSANAPEWNAP